MRTMLALAAGLWLLGIAPGTAQERQRPVSGAVKDVDLAAHVLTLADGDYYVPAGTFELKSVKPGDQVVLQWQERAGRRVVLEVTHSAHAD